MWFTSPYTHTDHGYHLSIVSVDLHDIGSSIAILLFITNCFSLELLLFWYWYRIWFLFFFFLVLVLVLVLLFVLCSFLTSIQSIQSVWTLCMCVCLRFYSFRPFTCDGNRRNNWNAIENIVVDVVVVVLAVVAILFVQNFFLEKKK